MTRRCLAVAVVEDENHEMLIRRFLRRRGLDTHEIRIERSPSGQGSAENWVRKIFVKEVKAYRRRHARTALIVVIDADTGTVQNRLRQLDHALTAAKQKSFDPTHDQIARLVPKRNVETWILCLAGREVDEQTDYKHTRNEWSDLVPQAAVTLADWARLKTDPPQSCISSLRSGIGEMRRLTVLDR